MYFPRGASHHHHRLSQENCKKKLTFAQDFPGILDIFLLNNFCPHFTQAETKPQARMQVSSTHLLLELRFSASALSISLQQPHSKNAHTYITHIHTYADMQVQVHTHTQNPSSFFSQILFGAAWKISSAPGSRLELMSI